LALDAARTVILRGGGWAKLWRHSLVGYSSQTSSGGTRKEGCQVMDEPDDPHQTFNLSYVPPDSLDVDFAGD
jgi:hypothetical protein